MQTKISTLYNPSNQEDKDIKENFVIRQEEFTQIINGINKDDSSNFLLIAQRGMGKTSLLLRLEYEINNNFDFANTIPIRFKEEQYNIVSLCTLWETVADELDKINDFEGISEKLDEAIDNGVDDCFELILDILEKNKKKIVLLVDNFGDMLGKFTSFEVNELKKVLSDKHLQLISASARVLESASSYDKTFFEDFNKVTLKGLTREETETLLSSPHVTSIKNAKEIVENKSSQIEIIRRLTGGVPRTMILLFTIFEDETTDVFSNLEHTLDMVTPLYKHRMDDLSPQLQKMVHVMALAWDGMTFDEIKKKLRGIDEDELYHNLLQSEKNSLININPIEGDGNIYQLRERFFNIWYLMRYGRTKNKENILWLVKFLQVWCTPAELKDRAYKHIEMLQNGDFNSRGAKYMADALANSIESDEILKEKLQTEAKKYLEKNDLTILEDEEFENENLSFKDKVKYYEKEILKNSDDYYLYYSLGDVYRKEEKYNEAIEYYSKSIQLDNSYIKVYHNLGIIYRNKKEFDKAIEFYLKAIELDAEYIPSYMGLAYIYMVLQRYEEGIGYYKRVIQIDSEYIFVYDSLGDAYRFLKESRKAIEYYNKAIELDDEYVYSYEGLAQIYITKRKYDKAIEYYKKIIEINDKYVNSYKGIAYAYEQQGKLNESIYLYEKIIELDPTDTDSYMSLGIIYFNREEHSKAIKYLKDSLKINPKDAYVQNNLGFIYKYQKNYNKAREHYKKAIEINPFQIIANINLAIIEENKNIALDLIKNVIEINPKIYQEIIGIMFYTKEDKVKTISLIDEVLNLEKNQYNTWIRAIVRVWGTKFQDSTAYFREAYLKDKENKDEITKYILLLISAKQYSLVGELFFDKTLNLQNKFRPLYYTLMFFMQEKYPTEYKRMGEELLETVEELIDEVYEWEEIFEDDLESEVKKIINIKDMLQKLKNSPNEYFQEAISFVENYNEKSELYIQLLDTLAGLYDQTFLNKSHTGKFDDEWYNISLPLYLEAIEIRKELFGDRSIHVENSYIYLANLIKNLSDSPENSTDYYLEAIKIIEKNLKDNGFNKKAFDKLDSLMKNINKLFFINSENSISDLNFRIDKIKIENFKQYKSSFSMEFSKKVNIIIGQNAIGKTSLLQAITLALLKENSFDKLTNYSKYITKGKDESQISLIYNKGEKNVTIKKDKREIDDNYFIPFVLTYGSNFFTEYDKNPTKILDDILNETIYEEFAHTIFLEYTNEFWNPLSILEGLTLSSHKTARDKENIIFERINSFLESEPFSLEKNRKDNRYYFYFKKENDNTEFYLDDLSEGYRGNILLITDMLIKILGVGWKPKTIEGIVLIDEFDKHLHPRWQSKLVDKLIDSFPKIQFIMTTHNPMSMLDRDAEEITIIEEIEGKVEALKEIGTKNIDVGMVLLKYFNVPIVGKTMSRNLNEITKIKLQGRRKLTQDDKKRIKELEQELQYTSATDFIYNRAYFNFLIFLKENKGIDFGNYENLKDEDMLTLMEEYKGLF